ncbi:hypothetical protein AwWohl_12010 [Gammaproteobacteria bacterium]|nr:hypothetical protein AwWohl_12010 [Gammaproteobacteria bacterium]
MSRASRQLFAKIFAITMTMLICFGMIFLGFKHWTSVESSGENSGETATEIASNNAMQSQIITNEQVEKELNHIADQKLELERKKIAEEKAIARAKQLVIEKAAQEKLAAENAAKKVILDAKIAQKKIEDDALALKEALKAKAEKEKLEKEKLEKEKLEKEKLEKEKAEKLEKDKQEKEKAAQLESKQAAAKKLATDAANKLAADKLAAAKISADKALAAANASKIARALEGYGNTVDTHVRKRWNYNDNTMQGLSATVFIRVSANGEILGQPKITKSSGNTIFDQEILAAVIRSNPLPMPTEPLARQLLAKEGIEAKF